MALISQDEIQKIRSSVNIVDVIRSYIPLEHKGKNYFCICPFHEDHSPSMSISEEKQIYKCFSCGAAGNVFTFVQNYENITFLEAVELIAAKNGINLSTKITSKQNNQFTKYYEIMEISEKFYHNNLKTEAGKNALTYLNKRGLSKAIIDEFNIGLSLKEKDLLYQILKSKQYSDNDIKKVGVVNFENNIYDNFNNRIMFPLQDMNGKTIGFSGRIYDESEGAKYLNTRETVLFRKGEILFNYHRAKSSAYINKSVIIVEGYMDAIRLYANGIKNVVACMGTSLTKEQINLLKKLKSKIILCLDNDEPGQKAIYEIGKILENNNFEVEVIKLSGAKDPDEYIISQGIEAFKNNLKKPLKYFDFCLNYLKQNKNLNNTIDLATYINDVLNDISKESDEILIDLTLKKLSQEYNLEYEILKDKLKKINNSQIKILQNKPNKKKNKPTKNKYDVAARRILYYMMNEAKYIRIYQNNLVFFDNLNYREITKEIIYYYNLNKTINIADFLSFANTNERFYSDILDIISECNEDVLTESVFNDYLNTIKSGNEKNTIKELKQSLKEELDKNKKIELAMKIAEIKKGSV